MPISQAEKTALRYATYTGIAVLFAVVFLGAIFFFHRASPLPKPTATAASTFTPEETGFYLDYKYSFVKQDDKVAALFQPKMLPRNDAILIGATRQIIKQAYGKEVGATPTVVGKELKFAGSSVAFYVMIIKEDTGEISSMVIRK